jgi:hypothetical protein
MVELVEIELPDGEVMLAEVKVLDADVGSLDRFALNEVTASAARIGDFVYQTMRKSMPRSPDRIAVQIGLKLAVKSGALTSILAEASSEASVTVQLEWDVNGQPGNAG